MILLLHELQIKIKNNVLEVIRHKCKIDMYNAM